MKALIVEDDFTNRLLLQSFLSHYGECHIAVNGKEAIEAYQAAAQQKQRYDLICMDILMPEMDGRDAIRAIRRLEADASIYAGCGAPLPAVSSFRAETARERYISVVGSPQVATSKAIGKFRSLAVAAR